MTNETEQLRRMVEARERATKGPWISSKAVTQDNTGGYDYAITVDGEIIAELFQHTGWADKKTGKYEAQPVEANAAFTALSGTLDLRAILTRMEKMEEALRHIETLESRADGSVGMVDFPHTKALRVATKIAKEAFE